MVEYLKKPIVLTTIICIVLFYSGIVIIPEQKPYHSVFQEKDVNFISGKIISSPVKSSSKKTYSCKFKIDCVKTIYGGKAQSNGIVTLYIPSELVESYFPGKLYSPAQNKGAYLYETGGKYKFKGKFTDIGFVAKECSFNEWEQNFWGKINWFRAICRLQFKRLMYCWGEAGGLLLALLCGAREYTNADTAQAFKNAGLSHILALSGMHLSMFSAIAIFIGDKVGRKKLTFIIRFIVLILFVWFAGFSPSLLRAFICAVLILCATIASVQKPDMILILCFSFILQCCISPSDINNAGFLLSYGALAGILIGNKAIYIILSKIIPGYFAASLSSSTAANLFTIPISLKVFGSFCPIGIIATTFVSPLVTVLIYSGLVLILLSLIFPVISIPSGIFINYLYTIIKEMVLFFSKAPIICV